MPELPGFMALLCRHLAQHFVHTIQNQLFFFHIINYFYKIIFPCPQPVAQHPVLGHPHQPGPVRQRGLGQQAVLRAGRQDDGNKNNITSPESNPSFAS